MDRSKILVVDDNPEIREIVNVLLTSEGYDILEAKDGEEAIACLNQEIDLIILDIMMPKLNGYQTCVEIRKISNAPVLFLTAHGKESDKTLGFSSGADDFLVKPFSYNELTARVKSLLRRFHVYKGKGNTLATSDNLQYEHIYIDINKEIVYVHDEKIDVTEIEYRILLLLLSNRKQIFSAQELYEKIWDEAYFYSANNTIMVHIRNIRKKVEDKPEDPTIIKTIWGKGYRCE